MRIAVPTDDGTSISAHFGRSAAFLVFEVDEGAIKSRELRPNATVHSHAQGSCAAGTGNHGEHGHRGILTALSGCDFVICAGMGWRAVEALKAGGITPLIAQCQGTADEMVIKHLKGELAVKSESSCGCAH